MSRGTAVDRSVKHPVILMKRVGHLSNIATLQVVLAAGFEPVRCSVRLTPWLLRLHTAMSIMTLGFDSQ